MDYEKLYKEAKDRMSKAYNSNRCTIGFMNEIFPELEDNKDERIRIFLTKFVKENMFVMSFMADVFDKDEVLAWLEKQGEHARFIEAIQVGDKVTKNEDGVLVNLSQLKRVAKPSEQNQVEQKPAEWSEEDEHYELEEFAKIVRGNLTGISKAVQKLFEAKYLQLTGNKMYGGFKD